MSYILQIQMSYHYRRVFLNNLYDINCIREITKATWEQHNCISIKIYWDISMTKMRSSNILYSSYLVYNNKYGVKLMFIYLYPINISYTIYYLRFKWKINDYLWEHCTLSAYYPRILTQYSFNNSFLKHWLLKPLLKKLHSVGSQYYKD